MPHTTNDIVQSIRLLSAFQDAAWLDSLEVRKKEEAEFHDDDRLDHRDQNPESTSNRRFYQAAEVANEHLLQWLSSSSRDRIFLDFACGNGTHSVRAAEAGAALAVGIDISPVSVRNAAENAAKAGVSERTCFLQRDCENTGLPSDSFDLVLCSGMLHHLNLEAAFPELSRIVRPGGRILCLEALAYNPLIQLYRNLTPHLRTDWEKRHILGMREVRFAERWFRVENLRFFCLTSPVATLLPKGARRSALRFAHAVDGVLTRIPLVQLMSWQFAFELVKPD